MRFVENIDDNVSPDFLPRRYFAPLMRILPYYIVSLALVIGTLHFQEWFGSASTTILAFALISIICGVAFFHLQQSNDLVMATDFQNLLFAGAASLGSSFCFFVRRDGTIVYANDGTRQMFPGFVQDQSNALDSLLSKANVGKDETNRLYSALTRGKKESLNFQLTDASGETNEYIIIIQPLQRPAGYFAVHGRPFTSQREAKVKLPGVLGNTSLEKIETLLDSLPVGVYLTNQTGLVDYVNPALEQMLGYNVRSLANESLPIQRLVYHADGFETGEFTIADFAGNALLSCRNQSLARGFLDQRKIIKANGDIDGVLGIVTPMS